MGRRALTCVRVRASRQDNGNYGKRSALHWASTKGMVGTVAKLLSLGADAALADWYGKTPVQVAANREVKAVFVEHREHLEHGVITDDNKNMLLLD